MLDDNVTSTYVVEIEDLLKAPGQARVRPVAAKPCGFSTPMLGVESLLDESNEWTIRKREQGTGGADRQEVRFTSFRRGDPNDTPDEAINFDAQDVIGQHDQRGSTIKALRKQEGRSAFLNIDPKQVNLTQTLPLALALPSSNPSANPSASTDPDPDSSPILTNLPPTLTLNPNPNDVR